MRTFRHYYVNCVNEPKLFIVFKTMECFHSYPLWFFAWHVLSRFYFAPRIFNDFYMRKNSDCRKIQANNVLFPTFLIFRHYIFGVHVHFGKDFLFSFFPFFDYFFGIRSISGISLPVFSTHSELYNGYFGFLTYFEFKVAPIIVLLS